MFCSVLSAVISGVEAVPVWVEADVSDGMPVFSMVGYVTTQVREAADRVKTALRSLGISLPPKRITINLSPGDLRKEGTGFDLPIAAAVLMALGKISRNSLEKTMVLGELHLDGRVEGITGILPSVLTARDKGCKDCIIPAANLWEGKMVEGIQSVGIHSLKELVAYCQGEWKEGSEKAGEEKQTRAAAPGEEVLDFCDIRGQDVVKRAAVIAAAGFHNLLLSGPPGSGKSMTAQRIPEILPPMSLEESLEVSKIYSVAGLLPADMPLIQTRPYRAPHHTLSPQALCGGGRIPKPGEVTLAHRGVLFLDELPEMAGRTLELLRQPLEEHRILLSRMAGTYSFPAKFLLVAAMNSCPCGYYPDMNRCTCSPKAILAYQQRISQPILDRIDLRVEMAAVPYRDLIVKEKSVESSARMAQRVRVASEIQKERFKGRGFLFNSEIPPGDLETYCVLTQEAYRLLEHAFQQLGLSVRGYHRTLRVARTIADLEEKELIQETHISEAVCYRQQERYSRIQDIL